MSLVADASAILAIALSEPDAADFSAKLSTADRVWISAMNWWEVKVRMHAVLGARGLPILQDMERSVAFEIEPVTREQADAAAETFAKFKGRPHRLNMGDSFAHALAVQKRAPLLYKGNEFQNTGIEKA